MVGNNWFQTLRLNGGSDMLVLLNKKPAIRKRKAKNAPLSAPNATKPLRKRKKRAAKKVVKFKKRKPLSVWGKYPKNKPGKKTRIKTIAKTAAKRRKKRRIKYRVRRRIPLPVAVGGSYIPPAPVEIQSPVTAAPAATEAVNESPAKSWMDAPEPNTAVGTAFTAPLEPVASEVQQVFTFGLETNADELDLDPGVWSKITSDFPATYSIPDPDVFPDADASDDFGSGVYVNLDTPIYSDLPDEPESDDT
ncbi:hypothetical protein [Paenibacillus alkalitolerans]|uniref:hypothetical protein n=1 Tax=Paenibacillus alkalitolerans TaxID=2799335 RepID=UPI0018F394D6|nr:hypothetical protein [Paenibacillus alkalitolerans]